MEVKIWIIGQLAVDVVMLAILVGVLHLHWKRRIAFEGFQAVLTQSEGLLSEMLKISGSLERNLEEKKGLTSALLTDLDTRIVQAQEASQRIQQMLVRWEKDLATGSWGGTARGPSRETIDALLSKGLTREDISRHFGVSVGELELILKLREGSAKPERPS